MAALAPPPYRPSPAQHTSTAPSSTNSTTPSKKQEQLAAGRRRLEAFKRKKAAEKGKKTSSAAAASDQPVQNVLESEQLSVLPAITDSSVSTSKPIDSNGYPPEDFIKDDLNAVATKSSVPSATHEEDMVVIASVSEGLLSTGELFRKDPRLTAVPSGGGSNERTSIRELNSNIVREQTSFKSSTTTPSGKADGQSGLLSVQDSKNTNRTGIQVTPPLGSSGPLFVPAPPPARKEIFGVATGHGKPETTTKNPVAVHPSPFNKIPSSQGLENSFNPLIQKPNGGSLVMLDRELVPSDNAGRKGPSPLSVSELEKDSKSGKSRLPAWVPSSEGARSDNQTDGIVATSGFSTLPYINVSNSLNVKSEKGNGSDYAPAMSSSSSVIKPSMKLSESFPAFNPSVSESLASKNLPLPPLLTRPPLSTSYFTPEPFVPPVFKNVSDFSFSSSSSSSSSFSSSTLLSSTALSTSTLDTALAARPRAPPSAFQFPGPLSAINAIHENGKPEVIANSLAPLLQPVPHPSVGEIRTQTVKVAEPVDQSHQLWPSSGGDDFAMLEQHIEDLTQEKFSLQRGLDAARGLAETLAQENSALTEDFNNQGALMNDLKAETERQQGEIRAQAVVVNNMKVGRDKAAQDCKAAVERSQALAAEVIALEEKVLRARSEELKLRREMESLSAETESQKRQISSLDKDRANLKTLMEALQEEKGLLQTQIRKATAASGSIGESSHPKSSSWMPGAGLRAKADASTSTTDDFELGTFLALGQGSTAAGPLSTPNNLGFEPLEQQRRVPLIIPSLPSRPLPSPSHHAGQASLSFSLANEGGSTGQFSPAAAGNLSGRSLNLGPVSSVLPPDHAATIGNINGLITELAEEKEALVKALRAESVGAAELRSLNGELSHKLEVQTQRLELAVAQSMAANDSTPRVGSTYAVSRIAPDYIDEGDEVVDRVLGWIMQLFPSGSSRRKRL